MAGAPSRASRRGILLLALVGAFALGAAPAFADGKSPLTATAEEKQRAQDLYQRGTQEYDAKQYAVARATFHASYEIVASPASRFMIARTLRDQLLLAAAYEEFERTEEEARALGSEERYRKITEESAKEKERLSLRIARITVHVKGAGEGATVQVGKRELPKERWDHPFPVPAGATSVVATAANGARVVRWVTAQAGKTVDVDLELGRGDAVGTTGAAAAPVPAPPPASPGEAKTFPAAVPPPSAGAAPKATPDAAHGPRRSLVPYAIASGAVGVAGFAVFGVAGAMTLATHSRLEGDCSADGACPHDRLSDVDAGRTQQTIANIGLVVGAAGTGAAITLFLLHGARSRSRSVGAGPGSVRLGGSF